MEENKNEALVTPELLVWARKKAGLTISQVIKKIPEATEWKILYLIGWEEGTLKPTIAQAQKLAEIYKVPFDAFFLPEPPKEEEGKVTLRRIVKEIENAPNWSEELLRAFKKLKQLEKQIENMIPPSTLKNNCVACVTRKAVAGMLQDILGDILGEKGDMK